MRCRRPACKRSVAIAALGPSIGLLAETSHHGLWAHVLVADLAAAGWRGLASDKEGSKGVRAN